MVSVPRIANELSKEKRKEKSFHVSWSQGGFVSLGYTQRLGSSTAVRQHSPLLLSLFGTLLGCILLLSSHDLMAISGHV